MKHAVAKHTDSFSSLIQLCFGALVSISGRKSLFFCRRRRRRRTIAIYISVSHDSSRRREKRRKKGLSRCIARRGMQINVWCNGSEGYKHRLEEKHHDFAFEALSGARMKFLDTFFCAFSLLLHFFASAAVLLAFFR
jgi:hypothetical protein